MDKKSCLYRGTQYWNSVPARLSSHTDWTSCICIWVNSLVFRFPSSSIYNSFIYDRIPWCTMYIVHTYTWICLNIYKKDTHTVQFGEFCFQRKIPSFLVNLTWVCPLAGWGRRSVSRLARRQQRASSRQYLGLPSGRLRKKICKQTSQKATRSK